MKKILYIGQVFPYPPTGGGKIKALNTLLTLAKRYKVHAVFISEESPSPNAIAHLVALGIEVKVFYRPEVLVPVYKDIKKLVYNYLKLVPHSAYKYYFTDIDKYIQAQYHQVRPDIVHVAHVGNSLYLRSEYAQSVVFLETENVEFALQCNRFVFTKNIQRKLYLLLEGFVTYFFEKSRLRLFDHIFSISQADRDSMRKYFGIKNVSTQTLYYPVQNYNARKHSAKALGFIGNLNWPPNEDAVERFLTKVYPILQKKVPEITVHIVGSCRPESIERYKKLHNVIFHGHQHDISIYLRQWSAFILPFRMGSGIRVKALTALSFGVPVVSTAMGVMGLSAQKNQDFLQADTAASFADNVLHVLTSSESERLSKNGKKYVEEYHSVKVNALFLKEYAFYLKKFRNGKVIPTKTV